MGLIFYILCNRKLIYFHGAHWFSHSFFLRVMGSERAVAIALDPPAKPNRKYAVCFSATHRNGKSDPLCKPSCSFFPPFFFLKMKKVKSQV